MRAALDFAHNLITLSEREIEPDYLTRLQLQKLLYYVQGWSLALRQRVAFPEAIEAWRHGPVVAEVWQHFKNRGDGALRACGANASEELDENDRFFTRAVWEAYKGYSPLGLRAKTHAEAPWREARGNLPDDAPSSSVISIDSLRAYFNQLRDDDRECHFVGMPDWHGATDTALARVVQQSFIKHSQLLRHLAQ